MQFRVQFAFTVADNAETIVGSGASAVLIPTEMHGVISVSAATPFRSRNFNTPTTGPTTTRPRGRTTPRLKTKTTDCSVPVSPSVRRYTRAAMQKTTYQRERDLAVVKNYFKLDAVGRSYSLTSFPIRKEVLIADA